MEQGWTHAVKMGNIPKLLGLEASRQKALQLVRESKAALEPWHDKAAPLLALADYVASRAC